MSATEIVSAVMKTTPKKTIWVAMGATALALVAVAAGRSAAHDDDDGRGRAPVGSWRATASISNPPGAPPLDSLMTFVPGGGLVEARRLYVTQFPGGPVVESPGHGAWQSAGHGRYDVTFQFLFQAGPGHPLAGEILGTDKIRWRATLNRHTGELEGPWKSQITDPSGGLLFQAEGTIVARRLLVEPL